MSWLGLRVDNERVASATNKNIIHNWRDDMAGRQRRTHWRHWWPPPARRLSKGRPCASAPETKRCSLRFAPPRERKPGGESVYRQNSDRMELPAQDVGLRRHVEGEVPLKLIEQNETQKALNLSGVPPSMHDPRGQRPSCWRVQAPRAWAKQRRGT